MKRSSEKYASSSPQEIDWENVIHWKRRKMDTMEDAERSKNVKPNERKELPLYA